MKIILNLKKHIKSSLIDLWKLFEELQNDENYDSDDTNKLYDILDMFDDFKVKEN